MRVMVDVYTPTECHAWLRAARDHDDMRLVVEECGTHQVGEAPEWLEYELSEAGWDTILETNSWSNGDQDNWFLRNGVAPLQPFQIVVTPPRYYRCGGWEYPDETDVEYYYEIIGRARMTPKQAARAWEQWTRAKSRAEVRAEIRKAKLDEKRATSLKDFRIQYDVYWTGGYYDGSSPPDGRIVRLVSTYQDRRSSYVFSSGYCPLLEGRADDYDYRQGCSDLNALAWERLLLSVRERLPHLDPEFVRKLPTY